MDLFAKPPEEMLEEIKQRVLRTVQPNSESAPLVKGEWRGHQLHDRTRIPLELEDDSRVYVSLLSLAATWSDYVLKSQQLLPPPVTGCLLATCFYFYLQPEGLPLRRVALVPQRVIERREYQLLFISPFVHMDLPHLLSNTSVLLPCCNSLEKQRSKLVFIGELSLLTLLTESLYVCWAWLDYKCGRASKNYHSLRAVGMSGTAMAVKTVASLTDDGWTMAYGFVPVPSRCLVWLELLMLTLTVPDEPLAYEFSGIFAGLSHVYLISPVLTSIRNRRRMRKRANVEWPQQPQGRVTTAQPVVQRLLTIAKRAAEQFALAFLCSRVHKLMQRRRAKQLEPRQ